MYKKFKVTGPEHRVEFLVILMYSRKAKTLIVIKQNSYLRGEWKMNKSGYAIECTECGSREIKKGEPKNSINIKTMSEVTFRILECKNCGYKERENIN